MTRFSHLWLSAYTRAHIWLTEACTACQSALAHRLGDGISAVYKIKPARPMRRLYCIDDFLGSLWYLLNGYSSMGLNDDDVLDDGLFYVRFVMNGAFRSCLTHGFHNGHIHNIASACVPFHPLVVFLNDINVTRSVAPLMTSFGVNGDITVRQLVSFLLSSSALSRADVDHLALRSDKLLMTFVDTHLNELAFADDAPLKF
jgi:hypothetical protein